MKSKGEIQLEATKAIISGELLLEEAMVKYNVKDKRTMTAWLKKSMPLLKALESRSDQGFDTASEISNVNNHHHDTFQQGVLRENTLLKKIIDLQDKVHELEEKNTLLTRHRNRLLEKVSSLELHVQIQQKKKPQ